MGFREKSAWATAGALIIGYGWYVATVVVRFDGGPVAGVGYQGIAVTAAVAVVVLIAVAHVVLASGSKPEPRQHRDGIVTGGRIRGVILASAAVLAMALAMVEAEYFWIANVALAGLVSSELAAAGTEIKSFRKEA
ncbi:MAG: hypothetical protein WCE80_05705 [Acidimicrobiia bacterium]